MPKKNLLLEGKDKIPKDISGSIWPMTSGFRPLMAQVLLRDLETAYPYTVSFGKKVESPLPCQLSLRTNFPD